MGDTIINIEVSCGSCRRVGFRGCIVPGSLCLWFDFDNLALFCPWSRRWNQANRVWMLCLFRGNPDWIANRLCLWMRKCDYGHLLLLWLLWKLQRRSSDPTGLYSGCEWHLDLLGWWQSKCDTTTNISRSNSHPGSNFSSGPGRYIRSFWIILSGFTHHLGMVVNSVFGGSFCSQIKREEGRSCLCVSRVSRKKTCP